MNLRRKHKLKRVKKHFNGGMDEDGFTKPNQSSHNSLAKQSEILSLNTFVECTPTVLLTCKVDVQ